MLEMGWTERQLYEENSMLTIGRLNLYLQYLAKDQAMRRQLVELRNRR